MFIIECPDCYRPVRVESDEDDWTFCDHCESKIPACYYSNVCEGHTSSTGEFGYCDGTCIL